MKNIPLEIPGPEGGLKLVGPVQMQFFNCTTNTLCIP